MAINIEQVNAMEAWFALRNDAAFLSGSPEDRHKARRALADGMRDKLVIDAGELRELVEEADAAYADEMG